MEAVIFPGQGAQYVGMGQSLYDNFFQAKELFDAMDSVLGYSLSDKCFTGKEEELKDTATQQLAILAVSIASFEVFKTFRSKISFLSGLSLGEYSCLYAAGVLSLEDVTVLVRERGLAMQKAAKVNPSTMFAVMGIDKELLEKQGKEEEFYVSNLNAPGQVVISLKTSDRDRIKASLEGQDAKVVELAVSGGFHSPFMWPAKEHLRDVVEKLNFKDAQIPIVSNFTAVAHTDKDEIQTNLLEQLTSPVLWKDCVGFMVSHGMEVFYEVGPSKVLRGLMRKINPSVKVVNLEKREDFDKLNQGQGEI